MRKLFFIILSIIATFTINHLDAHADEYIEIIKDSANIQFESNTSSIIIAKAKKGDVYRLHESKNEWYGIFMFSGEQRYVHKSLAKKINDIPVTPSSIEIKQKVFREISNIESRSTKESQEKYPNDLYKQIDLERILNDRYKLQIYHRYGLPIAKYHKLVAEGVKNGW